MYRLLRNEPSRGWKYLTLRDGRVQEKGLVARLDWKGPGKRNWDNIL